MKIKVLMGDEDCYDGPKAFVFEEELDYDDPEATVGALLTRVIDCMKLDIGSIALELVNLDAHAIASFAFKMGSEWSDPQKQLFRETFKPAYMEGEESTIAFAERQNQIVGDFESKKTSDQDKENK